MNAASPPRRALILIDVQNEYVDGQLRIEYPPIATSLTNIAAAAAAAIAAGIPIVAVQQNAPESSPIFARGSAGWALHASVARLPLACVVEKILPSALAGTPLAAWLRENAIDTLTVAGYMTQNCNSSTILQAAHEGWSVEYLSDASGAISFANRAGRVDAKQVHETYCTVFQSRFAAVMTTDEWCRALSEGTPPARDNILASNRRARQETA